MAKPSMQIKVLSCICLWLTLVPLASHLEAKVTKSAFGNMPDGTKVEIFTLEEGALKARIMTYGARLVSLEVPDRTGKVADIVLGYESLEPLHRRPQELLRIDRRPVRQPHRSRHFFARWQGLYATSECRRQHPARGNQRLRQAGVAGA